MESDSGDSIETENIPAVTGEFPAVSDACCKVERVTEAYNIPGIDREIRRQREQEGATLHELTDFVNDRLTIAAITSVDVEICTDPATVRAAIKGDESVSMVTRDTIREAMVGELDIERLQRDYVSHETIRKHLNEHLNISTAKDKIASQEDLVDSLRKLSEQYEDAIVGALDRANKEGIIDGRDFRVFSTRIECTQCSTSYRLQELIENAGCDCQSE